MKVITKPYLLQTLKELALLGAMQNKIEISSHELAKQLQTSQQTASRYLMDLDNQNMIIRELGIKKQIIQITETGSEVLEKELMQYKQIFDFPEKVFFQGRVVSGMGEGKYYTEQSGYVTQFNTKLGFIPFPGTLNIEIDSVQKNKLRILKNSGGIVIDEFTTENRTFGGVMCFHATIQEVPAAIVLPRRSHYSHIIEVISPHKLREKLVLKDNDAVQIIVYMK